MTKQELKRFPSLQAELAAATNEALERFREESKKATLRLVDMEASYLTVEFFRKLPQEVERAGNPPNSARPANSANPANQAASNVDRYAASNVDRYGEGHFRRIGSNVLSYIGMVSDTLRNTIPKAVVYCQVREAKLSLLSHFYVQAGKKEVLSLRLLLSMTCLFPIVAITISE